VLGDEVGLGVVAEQRSGERPTLVMGHWMGSPELFLGELGDAGRQPDADEVQTAQRRPGSGRGCPVVVAQDLVKVASRSVRES
jgi:hypothetical protein